MPRACRVCLGACIVMVFGVASASGVHLKGSIVRVGYQGRSVSNNSQGEDHYRQDTWVPVRVELGNEDGDLFDGRIEIRQEDRDGDEVVAQWPITIRDEYRRFYLYVPGGMSGFDWSADSQPFRVRIYDKETGGFAPLFDENEQPITYLEPPRSLRALSGATCVILDISENPVNQLGELTMLPDLTQEVAVLRLDPKELPDNATGLAMADIIVWDGGDPTIFDDPTRRDALVEWVRQGGTLVIGVSRNWNRLRNSPQFKEILPADLQDVQSITEPTGAMRTELKNELELDRAISVCKVLPGDLAPNAYAAMPDDPQRDEFILVARRSVDRGLVTLVTAEIKDLLEQGNTNQSFLQNLLLRQSRSRSESESYGQRNLFEQVEAMIGFATDTVLYFFFAFIFVIGYILVATAGIWFGLKRRGMVQHTWTAFALVTIATSGLSLAAVRLVRGIGSTVQEVQVVDLQAGQRTATADCYFGLKTATHVRQDLKLPKGSVSPEESASLPGALRPLPCDAMNQMVLQKTYSNSLRYDALASIGQLWDVPFRATLKKLQGSWRGEIEGSVVASLRSQTSLMLTGDSWIQNQLGTPLDDCYLFIANKAPSSALLPRIRVYPIGKIGDNDRITMGEIVEFQTKKNLTDREIAEGRTWPLPVMRDDLVPSWFNNIGIRQVRDYTFGDPNTRKVKVDEKSVVSALLLLSFYGEIEPDTIASRGVIRPLGANLDCSDRISTGHALFVGFSHDRGPARLFGRDSSRREGDDWDAYSVSNSLVMYRVWIPVK